MQSLRIIRYSAANAFADMRAMYTWRSWVFGWLGRMLAQVIFFTVLGRVIGSTADVRFLVIGNSLMASAIEALMVVASTTWERAEGTLPLLVSAPSELTWVFVGRSAQWPISGSATSVVALVLLGPFFGVTWSPAQVPFVILLVILTAATTYCFGLFLAALVLNARAVRNLVSNVAYLVMMAICGIQVPTTYWPTGVRWLAGTLPLTYCTQAVRLVASGASAWSAAGAAAAGLLLGAVWLTAAWAAFRWFARRGRRLGTIDFVG